MSTVERLCYHRKCAIDSDIIREMIQPTMISTCIDYSIGIEIDYAPPTWTRCCSTVFPLIPLPAIAGSKLARRLQFRTKRLNETTRERHSGNCPTPHLYPLLPEPLLWVSFKGNSCESKLSRLNPATMAKGRGHVVPSLSPVSH